MYKSISAKIWVKVVAFLLSGVFLFNQTAYARHYTPDKSMKEFFKSDADQAAMYVAGTVLSIAIPASGLLGPVSNSTLVISAGVNIGSQVAVACGADPKTTMIVGGAVGGLTSGFVNGGNLTSNLGLQTMVVNVVPWTASAATSAYLGEKNPYLGLVGGFGAGIATNAITQWMANNSGNLGGAKFTADGKLISANEVDAIETGRDITARARINEQVPDENNLKLVHYANDIVLTKGDVWRGIGGVNGFGTPIVDNSLGGAIFEAFRAVSPGQWVGLFAAAGVYEAMSKKDNRESALVASVTANFAGGLAGGLVNQWDDLGRVWCGITEEGKHSPWYVPEYKRDPDLFLSNVIIKPAIYAGIDYGLGRLTLNTGLSPVANNFINAGTKFLAGTAASTVIDKLFLAKELTISAGTDANGNLLEIKGSKPIWGNLFEFNLEEGFKDALQGTLPLLAPSRGINAGYNAIMYTLSTTRRFATGADYFTTMAMNFANSMDNVASSKLSFSVGSAIFDRDKIYYINLSVPAQIRNINVVDLNKISDNPDLRKKISESMSQFGLGKTVRVMQDTINEGEPLLYQREQFVISDAWGKTWSANASHFYALAQDPNKSLEANIKSIQEDIGRGGLEKVVVETGIRDEADKVFVTMKALNLQGITPLDFYGQPLATLFYKTVNNDIFSKSGLDIQPYATKTPGRKGIQLQTAKEFQDKVLSGFIDNSIFGEPELLRGTVYYYGALGRMSLVETNQILETPNLKSAKELMFYGYTGDTRTDYAHCVNAEGEIRQERVGFDSNSKKLTEHVEPLSIDAALAASGFPVSLSDYLGEIKEDYSEFYKRSYTSNALDSFESLETGRFAYDYVHNRVAMLPTYNEKIGYIKNAQGENEICAREVAQFVYQGLNQDDKGILTFNYNKKPLSYPYPLSSNSKIITFVDNQIIKQGENTYFGAYGYDTLLRSTLGLPDFSDAGAGLRNISVQPIEEEDGRKISIDLKSLTRQPSMGSSQGSLPESTSGLVK